MLAIQFSTITNGYRATLVFSNTGALGNGYDNYDITLEFDPSKASLVLPLPNSANQQYGLAANFAGTAFVNVSQLSQGKLVIGGISLSPLSTSTPLGSLDFTSVAHRWKWFVARSGYHKQNFVNLSPRLLRLFL